MRRYRASRPIAMALADGIVTRDTSVCDYGCGHGGDLQFLRKRGIRASGWDPVHYPRGRLQPADVVNLGYVLNVIEEPAEREQTLRRAFELCRKALVVAVRVDREGAGPQTFSDGCITSRGTFQKIYEQAEFLGYVVQTLGTKSYPASLGIAYVFKDEETEGNYIASRAFTRRLEYRTDLIEEFAKHPKARKLVRLANKLGRLPLAEEFSDYAALVETFGSPKRIERLLLGRINPDAFEGSREQRKEDIQTYLAMLRLRGIPAPPLSSLPSSIRADIRTIWKTYAQARDEANKFLFSLGQAELVQAVCQSAPVGKRVSRDLYVHTSAEDELPALLRLVGFAAKQIVGEVDYNIIKFATDGRSVSFLSYEAFDEEPHPPLRRSIRVFLPRADYSLREYTGSNVPILHRKDTLVSAAYPRYQVFRQLTEDEEALGLLSAPGIGYREAWERLLEERQVAIVDHRIAPNNASAC